VTCKPIYENLVQKKRVFDEDTIKKKRTKKMLCKGEYWFQLLAENLKDIIIYRVSLPNGKFEYLSPAVFEIFGYTPEEYYQDPTLFRKQLHPQWEDYFKQEWAKLLKGEMTPLYEYQIVHKSGKIKWVQQRNLLIRDIKGTPIEMEGLICDITDRKRIEEENTFIARIGRIIDSTLDINEVYTRFAAEVKKMIPWDQLLVRVKRKKPHDNEFWVAYSDGIVDPSWRVGSPYSPRRGKATSEVMTTRKALCIQPAEAQEIEQRYPQTAESFRMGLRSSMIIPLISKDETIGILSFRSEQLQAYTPEDLRLAERIGDQIAGAIANAQLFAHVKDTEKSLSESEARFRAIFEQVAVGVAEVDVSTGCYLRVNRRHCEILGMTEKEMLATTVQAVTHPEDPFLHAGEQAKMVSGKIGKLTMEKRCIRKDGAIIWVNVAVSPLWEPGGGPIRNIIVMEDITKNKELELELQSTLDKLEVRVRERTNELEEINTALSVLLKRRENDKKDLEEIIQANINQLVMPFLHKLKMNQSTKENIACLNVLETNLNNIVSPFINQLSSAFKNLTPKEIQIAELIKQGKRSKEIAELFGLAVSTVITHRNNIRHKLNLKSKGSNLRSHLLLVSSGDIPRNFLR
jgi:PAS domain S-box-containing protein